MRHGVDMTRPKHTRLARTRAHELRNDLTISEARLWSGIKNKATGARFRRQVPIGPWIADFACLDLAIDAVSLWVEHVKRTGHRPQW